MVIGALVAGAGVGTACDRTPKEAHEDAVEAQREADKTTMNAAKKADEAVNDATNDARAAAEKARTEAAEAQAKANEKIREANRDIVGKQDGVHDWAQTKIDDVNNLIDEARAKAQKANPAAKAKFNSTIDEVQAQRDQLQAELASLETKTGDQLDKNKAEFSDRFDRITDRIKSVQKSL
jgi:uncharacterized protein YPO0396